jgi:hypothetical protein
MSMKVFIEKDEIGYIVNKDPVKIKTWDDIFSHNKGRIMINRNRLNIDTLVEILDIKDICEIDILEIHIKSIDIIRTNGRTHTVRRILIG